MSKTKSWKKLGENGEGVADFKEDPEKESQANSGSGAKKEKSSRRREWSLCPQHLQTQVSWKCPWHWLHELLSQSVGSRSQIKLEQARGGWMRRIQRTRVLPSSYAYVHFSHYALWSHTHLLGHTLTFASSGALTWPPNSPFTSLHSPISFSYISLIKGYGHRFVHVLILSTSFSPNGNRVWVRLCSLLYSRNEGQSWHIVGT